MWVEFYISVLICLILIINPGGIKYLTLAASYGWKVEICIPYNVAIYMYPALQAKVLPMEFWIWKLRGQPVDSENHENYIHWNFLYSYGNSDHKYFSINLDWCSLQCTIRLCSGYTVYRKIWLGENFGEFGESWAICQNLPHQCSQKCIWHMSLFAKFFFTKM